MNSIPPQVRTTFDNFRKNGSLGPGAEKVGPDKEFLLFNDMRDTMQDVARFDKMDNVPGQDLDLTTAVVTLSPQTLAELGKPYTALTVSSYNGDNNAVLLQKSAGKRQSFELVTNDAAGPAVVTATLEDGGQWNFGSKRLLMENGAPVLGEMGIPRCVGEMLISK